MFKEYSRDFKVRNACYARVTFQTCLNPPPPLYCWFAENVLTHQLTIDPLKSMQVHNLIIVLVGEDFYL